MWLLTSSFGAVHARLAAGYYFTSLYHDTSVIQTANDRYVLIIMVAL